MYWKMSIDLSRPLVRVDGPARSARRLRHVHQLDATALLGARREPDRARIDDFAGMIDRRDSRPPIRSASAVCSSTRTALAQLERDRRAASTRCSTPARARARALRRAAAIYGCPRRTGSRFASSASRSASARSTDGRVGGVATVCALGARSSRSGSTPDHRGSRTVSREHQDINDVMLATSLAPAGFLASSDARDAA